MKKEKRPLKEQFDKFSIGHACSANDCTGLITHMTTEEEEEAYMEVYDYQATPAVSDESLEQIREGKNKF